MDTIFNDDDLQLVIESAEYIETQGNPHILAKVVGPMFKPNGESRNRRFYSRKLWENVLSSPDTGRKLKSGMLGTLLHPKDETYAHPIHSSHVIKKLWINESNGLGYGEAYILDTPVGRIVNTLYRSGLVEMFSSTRSRGKLSTKKTSSNVPYVDEDHYYLESIDFVLDPGFLEAKPQLLEECKGLACYMNSVSTLYPDFNNLESCIIDSKQLLEGLQSETARKIIKSLIK